MYIECQKSTFSQLKKLRDTLVSKFIKKRIGYSQSTPILCCASWHSYPSIKEENLCKLKKKIRDCSHGKSFLVFDALNNDKRLIRPDLFSLLISLLQAQHKTKSRACRCSTNRKTFRDSSDLPVTLAVDRKGSLQLMSGWECQLTKQSIAAG